MAIRSNRSPSECARSERGSSFGGAAGAGGGGSRDARNGGGCWRDCDRGGTCAQCVGGYRDRKRAPVFELLDDLEGAAPSKVMASKVLVSKAPISKAPISKAPVMRGAAKAAVRKAHVPSPLPALRLGVTTGQAEASAVRHCGGTRPLPATDRSRDNARAAAERRAAESAAAAAPCVCTSPCALLPLLSSGRVAPGSSVLSVCLKSELVFADLLAGKVSHSHFLHACRTPFLHIYRSSGPLNVTTRRTHPTRWRHTS